MKEINALCIIKLFQQIFQDMFMAWLCSAVQVKGNAIKGKGSSSEGYITIIYAFNDD